MRSAEFQARPVPVGPLGAVTVRARSLRHYCRHPQRAPDADQPLRRRAFQVAEGDLHEMAAQLSDLVTAALQQGRAQFRSGTERQAQDTRML